MWPQRHETLRPPLLPFPSPSSLLLLVPLVLLVVITKQFGSERSCMSQTRQRCPSTRVLSDQVGVGRGGALSCCHVRCSTTLPPRVPRSRVSFSFVLSSLYHFRGVRTGGRSNRRRRRRRRQLSAQRRRLRRRRNCACELMHFVLSLARLQQQQCRCCRR